MLNEILKNALAVMADRQSSPTVYCGWGTFVDVLVEDYLASGGSWALARKVLALAYYK